MKPIEGNSQFGHAGRCRTFKEAVTLLKVVVGEDATKATAAFAMLLAAHAVAAGEYRNDALKVLDALALAKAELDSAAAHTHPTTAVTADILASAQAYAAELTIPVTEWPLASDIVANVLETASEYAEVNEWKRVVKNERGAVIGIEKM